MSQKPLHILIFGAGAVGQGIGGILAADGHNVDCIVRSRYLSSLNDTGLHVGGIFGEYSAGDTITFYDTVAAISGKTYDYVLITTKSYDTAASIESLKSINDQSFSVVSLQNGCGNLEKITTAFGTGRCLAGRVITGFTIDEPGKVRITVHADAIHIGGAEEGTLSKHAGILADAISHAGIPTVATKYIERDLYAKLLYNCALNPLGAMLRVHYGALGESESSRNVMDAVMDEVFLVIQAIGGKTHWASAEEYRRDFYENQLPPTAKHRSSMLQDLESGKPTEIDALTGFVSTKGRKHAVPTPVCDTLSQIIRFMEKH